MLRRLGGRNEYYPTTPHQVLMKAVGRPKATKYGLAAAVVKRMLPGERCTPYLCSTYRSSAGLLNLCHKSEGQIVGNCEVGGLWPNKRTGKLNGLISRLLAWAMFYT